MNRNGNGNGPNGRGPNGFTLAAIPELVMPDLPWEAEDLAGLRGRLDLYDDFILLTRYQEGRPVSRYLVDPLETAVALGGININSGLLPEGCLFWNRKNGQEGVGVYLPPRVWTVAVRGEPQAWRVPLPGLVFAGRGYDYQVWAVMERPTQADQQLYLAPCPNVHPDGVCRGSAPFPPASPATIWQAVDVFFSSRFNHDLSNQKSRKYPEDVLDHWRELDGTGAEEYPLDDLVGTNVTLRRLMNA